MIQNSSINAKCANYVKYGIHIIRLHITKMAIIMDMASPAYRQSVLYGGELRDELCGLVLLRDGRILRRELQEKRLLSDYHP